MRQEVGCRERQSRAGPWEQGEPQPPGPGLAQRFPAATLQPATQQLTHSSHCASAAELALRPVGRFTPDSDQPLGWQAGAGPGVVCCELAPCEQMKTSGGWAGKPAGGGPVAGR